MQRWIEKAHKILVGCAINELVILIRDGNSTQPVGFEPEPDPNGMGSGSLLAGLGLGPSSILEHAEGPSWVENYASKTRTQPVPVHKCHSVT